jgi:hypothetical protein
MKVLNYCSCPIEQILTPKYFGELYFAEKWSKCFEESITVIPTRTQIQNFKISKPLNFFKPCAPSISNTSNIITTKRILSKGERKRKGCGAVSVKSLNKKNKKCLTCGGSFSSSTRHSASACRKYQQKHPKYHLELQKKDMVAQNNFDSHDSQQNEIQNCFELPYDTQKEKNLPEIVFPEKTITQTVLNNFYNLFK